MKRMLKRMFAAAALFCALAACNTLEDRQYDTGKQYSRVLTVLYMGNSNLFVYMEGNIDSVLVHSLPTRQDSRALLFYNHVPGEDPVLYRVFSDWSGRTCTDTLLTLPSSTISTSTATLTEVLTYVDENFPSDHHGILLSNHGTGWVPPGYYNNPTPTTKAFGQEYDSSSPSGIAEISLRELASSIPMKTDYLILDACLMGGVETAYELRNCTDKLFFSATEIMGVGYRYETLVRYLLQGSEYDMEGFCDSCYENLLEKNSYGTGAVVNTGELENLASLCAPLFEKYRSKIAALDKNEVQGFFRFDRSWFYDLEDILVKAGISAEEKAGLDETLAKCVTAKFSTENFLRTFDINTYCGLSMYMPSAGNSYLDDYYTGLDWNKATGLVK